MLVIFLGGGGGGAGVVVVVTAWEGDVDSSILCLAILKDPYGHEEKTDIENHSS